jgi:hypothetical protein
VDCQVLLFGLAIVDQPDPFQCSMSVLKWPGLLYEKPAATQLSRLVHETPPESSASASRVGVLIRRQVVPFQASDIGLATEPESTQPTAMHHDLLVHETADRCWFVKD